MSYIPPEPSRRFFVGGAGSVNHAHCGGSRPRTVQGSCIDSNVGNVDARVIPPPAIVVHDPYLAIVPCVVTSTDRECQIASEHGLDFAFLRGVWTGQKPLVRSHLFILDKTGFQPIMDLDLAKWKPLIRCYFQWFKIHRSQCTQVWSEIVECLLAHCDCAGVVMPVEFSSWVFGCLCKFYLEDKKMTTCKQEQLYNPEIPTS